MQTKVIPLFPLVFTELARRSFSFPGSSLSLSLSISLLRIILPSCITTMASNWSALYRNGISPFFQTFNNNR